MSEPIYFHRHGQFGEPVLLLHGFTGSSQDWTSLASDWSGEFQIFTPDLPGHGRSGILTGQFMHRDAAVAIAAVLDQLNITSCKAIGVSAGANVLLHLATSRPSLIKAMVLVSATPYFPAQARPLMLTTGSNPPPGANAQQLAQFASIRGFAESYDDMNFTPPKLATIAARTLIVQGDNDPLYPVQLSVDMAHAIPHSQLWIVPGSGHGPIFGNRWTEFVRESKAFLEDPPVLKLPPKLP